jgi:hypothetical protein
MMGVIQAEGKSVDVVDSYLSYMNEKRVEEINNDNLNE